MTSPTPAAIDFPTITLVKVVVNDANGVGKAKPSNFTLQAIGPLRTVSGPGNSAAVTNQDVPAGRYELREFGDAVTTGYSPSVWSCVGNFTEAGTNFVVIGPEQNVVCTITNTFTGATPSPTPTATPTPTNSPTPTRTATPTPTSTSPTPSVSIAPGTPSGSTAASSPGSPVTPTGTAGAGLPPELALTASITPIPVVLAIVFLMAGVALMLFAAGRRK